jgi:resolvase-like protein
MGRTTTAHGRLMLAVLGGLAEFERELISARTGEGRERAKARGVKMGPKFKLTPHQQREAIKRRDTKGEPVREITRTFNVSHSMISRLRLDRKTPNASGFIRSSYSQRPIMSSREGPTMSKIKGGRPTGAPLRRPDGRSGQGRKFVARVRASRSVSRRSRR